MEIIRAGGGVLYRKNRSGIEILLIKRNGIWDLPKGKRENHESIKECAAREVMEEVGVPDVMVTTFLCETYHEYQQDGTDIGKYTSWYAMKPPSGISLKLQPQTEEGITGLKWLNVDDAKNKIGYENLKEVIKIFKAKVLK